MLTVAVPKRNKLQNIIVLTPKDGLNKNKKYKKGIDFFYTCGYNNYVASDRDET